MKQSFFARIVIFTILATVVFSPALGFVSSFAKTPTASANHPGGQHQDPGEVSTGTTTTTVGPQTQADSIGGTATTYPNYVMAGTSTTAGAPSTSGDPDPASGVNVASKEIDCGANFLCGLVQFVGLIFTFTTNLVATVAGLLADFSLWYSIQSSSYESVGGFIETGWKIVQSFAVLGFIFALLAVAFASIFGTTVFGTPPKKVVGFVVVMALLVSFSYFLTRTLIDVGNIVSIKIYEQINTGLSSDQVDSVSTTGSGTGKAAVALGTPSSFFGNNFMGMESISLGILNLVNPQELILNSGKFEGSGTFWISYDWSFYVLYLFLSFMVGIFNLVLIYIFVSMAILFIGRFVMLSFGIILSPIAFVSVTIDSLKDKPYLGFDDWLKQMVGLTFMAPIYLIFIYLAIMFLNWDIFPQTAANTGYLIVATVVLIKLMMVSLILLRGKTIAQEMAGHLGTMVGGAVNAIGVGAVGLATGGTAMLARNTIGRAGSAVATSGTVQRWADSKPSNALDDVKRRREMGARIGSFGVGKYKPFRGLGASVAKGNYSMGALKAKTAGEARTLGKTLHSVNPFDWGGSMSGRNIAAGLAKDYTYTDKDGKTQTTGTGNQGLATGLAKGFGKTIRGTTEADNKLDAQAKTNAAKTITAVTDSAFSDGMRDAMGPTGGATTPAAPTTTPPTTPPTGGPSPAETTPPTGPAPLMPARTPTSGRDMERDGSPAAKPEDVPATIGTLNVKDLHVETVTTGSSGKDPILGGPESSDTPTNRARNLLSGIQTPNSENSPLNYRADSFRPTTERVMEPPSNETDLDIPLIVPPEENDKRAEKLAMFEQHKESRLKQHELDRQKIEGWTTKSDTEKKQALESLAKEQREEMEDIDKNIANPLRKYTDDHPLET